MLVALSVGAPAQVTTTVAPNPAPVPQEPPTPPQPSPKAQRNIRRTVRQSRVTMVQGQEPVAPQVVTVIHRLSGVKLLRYLLRESGELGTVATIDPEAITSDAHASIIAGWALEDGKTILARLPQAAAEMEVQRFNFVWSDKDKRDKDKKDLEDKLEKLDSRDEGSATTAQRYAPRAPRMQPDLTVMMQDGRTFRARYVGIDGQTGLSVLQLAGAASTAISDVAAEKVRTGESVQLFAPERVADATPYTIRVRIGKTDAKVAKLASPKAQVMDRMMLYGVKLTPNVIGGVACDESGRTLGIVDAIEGNSARLVTADAVRAAARRVLESQASVPRPLLGIRGEAVDEGARKALLEYGWNEKQFEELLEKQVGILLTSVLPGTPAALANLQPGDIIIRVGDKDIKSAEEFSTLLTKVGTGEQVRFLVQRPKASAPVPMDVRLGGAYQPVVEWHFKMPQVPRIPGGLHTLGVEAVALSNKSASQWGASGLLVVAIEPESAAARGGLKEGDVIESIDGRPVGRGAWTFGYTFKRQDKYVMSVVRAREKKQVVIGPVE
ncbi:MAG TPA: PDZ domain-containing protein [Pyrinomonadaceae bacterium]